MPFKTRKIKAKNKKELRKKIIETIDNDLREIHECGVDEMLSVWSFFKFLVSVPEMEEGESMIFVTRKDSMIGRHRKELHQKCRDIEIKFMEELVAG